MAFFNYVPDINIFCNPSIVNSHRIHEKPKKILFINITHTKKELHLIESKPTFSFYFFFVNFTLFSN